ncbi:alpha/beta-hydrolase, partial [Cylindrobasidium torrendii FP15055 ss-10]
LVASFLAILSSLSCSAQPTIDYGGTTLVGTSYQGSGVDFFGGIPFAQPPLGDLRLRRPVAKFELDEPEFNATVSGPICLQPVNASVDNLDEKSEDCLTLDIYKPSNVEGPIPVMFW